MFWTTFFSIKELLETYLYLIYMSIEMNAQIRHRQLECFTNKKHTKHDAATRVQTLCHNITFIFSVNKFILIARKKKIIFKF